jgi:predicted DNA-binding transcriptional regulator AlpA
MGKSTLYRLIQHKRVPHRVLPTGVKCFAQADIDQILADGYRPAAA